MIHGVNCEKAYHYGPGYLHREDDDRPYDVDGALYCGRCHHALPKGSESNVKPKRKVKSRDRREVAKPVSSAQKPAVDFKCQGCNYRVAYEGDWCGECLCEEDGY